MKILMINKFLYPNGGSETYMFKLGKHLSELGHEVQYFGMEHPGRCVGNHAESYTSQMDFHGGSKAAKLLYPLKTIYSAEARKKLRLVLEDFSPDVIHINNFNYQLTPSILVEADAWRKKTGRACRILYTAHDYQLVCPNHMMYLPDKNELCDRCVGGHFANCLRCKCIHGSAARSAIGMLEGTYWNFRKVYEKLDTIVCCSAFMKKQLDRNPVLASRTVVLHNFIDAPEKKEAVTKKDYVLYFGRLAREKGIGTLLQACRELPEIPFVIAGSGPLEKELQWPENVRRAGFLSGEELSRTIREARFSICPAEWYENCPFSVIESIMDGTPVIGADLGGISELIRNGTDGELFESGNAEELKERIRSLWNDPERLRRYTDACGNNTFDTVETYTEKLLNYYTK